MASTLHPDSILAVLSGKWTDGTRPKDLYIQKVSRRPEAYVEVLIKGLASPTRRVQSGCSELASLLSEGRPDLLYPHIQEFVDNLDADAPVLRWEAVCTLGNLARVDKQEVLPPIVGHISMFLRDPSIVLQGHAVRALTKIALACPELAGSILEDLLSSEEHFLGNRLGFIIDAVGSFDTRADLAPRIRDFVEPCTQSEIPAVARKAKKTMRKLR